MTEQDKIYLAGIFDGEGCVTLYSNRGTELKVPRVCIAQKNQIEYLFEIKRNYGGGVHTHKGGVDRWFCSSVEETQKFLTDIIPYLRFKKAKAQIALAICILKGKGNGMSDADKLQRYMLQEIFHEQKMADRGVQ